MTLAKTAIKDAVNDFFEGKYIEISWWVGKHGAGNYHLSKTVITELLYKNLLDLKKNGIKYD